MGCRRGTERLVVLDERVVEVKLGNNAGPLTQVGDGWLAYMGNKYMETHFVRVHSSRVKVQAQETQRMVDRIVDGRAIPACPFPTQPVRIQAKPVRWVQRRVLWVYRGPFDAYVLDRF